MGSGYLESARQSHFTQVEVGVSVALPGTLSNLIEI